MSAAGAPAVLPEAPAGPDEPTARPACLAWRPLIQPGPPRVKSAAHRCRDGLRPLLTRGPLPGLVQENRGQGRSPARPTRPPRQASSVPTTAAGSGPHRTK